MTLLLLSSCRTPNVSYLQNLQDGQLLSTYTCPPITLQKGDKITIFVKSISPELSALFNLTSSTSGGSESQNQRAYTIDSNGNIDVPQIGTMHVEGCTREEVAQKVKEAIEGSNLAKNVTVIVEYRNIYYTVSGEVGRPGRYEFNRDHLNLLEAIVNAGDINISGKRDNILVLRQEGDAQRVYRVNITSSDSIVNSPAFQTRPGDYIYVEPTKKRQRETTVNGNTMLTPGFWISVVSFITSLVTFFKLK